MQYEFFAKLQKFTKTWVSCFAKLLKKILKKTCFSNLKKAQKICKVQKELKKHVLI
eukprot:UN08352